MHHSTTHHLVDRAEYWTVTISRMSVCLLDCPSESTLFGGKHLAKLQSTVLRLQFDRHFFLTLNKYFYTCDFIYFSFFFNPEVFICFILAAFLVLQAYMLHSEYLRSSQQVDMWFSLWTGADIKAWGLLKACLTLTKLNVPSFCNTVLLMYVWLIKVLCTVPVLCRRGRSSSSNSFSLSVCYAACISWRVK